MKTTLRNQIAKITASTAPVLCSFRCEDTSVQAELRVRCEWSITYPVDAIHYPKPVDNSWPQPEPWSNMRGIVATIENVATLANAEMTLTRPINLKTKTGPARRAADREAFEIEQGKALLAAYRRVTTKRHLAKITRKIADLQARQKDLLPDLRAHNSAVMLARRTAAVERREKNQEALTTGRFWEAGAAALKQYFSPPFEKNYLADVSERWRAALFVECESVSYKTTYGNWGHKLVGTGRGYLCGIDDNGDEWGHHCRIPQHYDQYGNRQIDGCIEDAMSDLFGICVTRLADCERQGDLLFCRETIPAGVALAEQPEPWEVRETHRIESAGLLRNGRHFRSAAPILVSHTSHAAISLPAGDYRLYALSIADAD